MEYIYSITRHMLNKDNYTSLISIDNQADY